MNPRGSNKSHLTINERFVDRGPRHIFCPNREKTAKDLLARKGYRVFILAIIWFFNLDKDNILTFIS